MEQSHFLTMMRTVQPHVSGRPRRSVELMLQSADLLQAVQQYKEPELSACDAGQDFIDFEGMLTDLQTVCNPAEAEIVNLILNFFRSRKIYAAYRAASQQNQAPQNFQEPKMQEKNSSETISNMNFLSAADGQPNHTQGGATTKTENHQNVKTIPGSTNAFRNLMENQALQSLLSPAQKENLNQIESLMQALS